MRLEIGEIVKTNYTSAVFEITQITRDCTCTHYLDQIDNKHAPLPRHVHMTCCHLEPERLRGEQAWLGYYDETTLESVAHGCGDYLTRLPNQNPVQASII